MDFFNRFAIAFGVESGCGFLAWFIEAPYTDITPKNTFQ